MTQITEDELWDSYFYPGTDVLINKLNCKEKKLLKEQEATMSLEKLAELQINPLNMGFGKQQLMAIHKYIFDDIYPFAGEYRRVNITKQIDMTNQCRTFLMVKDESDFNSFLDTLFNSINNELASCNNTIHFCDILAKLYTQLIYCHPFREGNGRSIREFIREFSIAKSKEIGIGEYELKWENINKRVLDQYIEVSQFFPGGTASLFYAALKELNDRRK